MTTRTTEHREGSDHQQVKRRAAVVALEPLRRLPGTGPTTAVAGLRQRVSRWTAQGTSWGYVTQGLPVVADAQAAAERLPAGPLLASGDEGSSPEALIRLAATRLDVELRDLAVVCLPEGAFWAAAAFLGCAPVSPVDAGMGSPDRSRWSRFQERALAWTGSQLDEWRLP